MQWAATPLPFSWLTTPLFGVVFDLWPLSEGSREVKGMIVQPPSVHWRMTSRGVILPVLPHPRAPDKKGAAPRPVFTNATLATFRHLIMTALSAREVSSDLHLTHPSERGLHAHTAKSKQYHWKKENILSEAPRGNTAADLKQLRSLYFIPGLALTFAGIIFGRSKVISYNMLSLKGARYFGLCLRSHLQNWQTSWLELGPFQTYGLRSAFI